MGRGTVTVTVSRRRERLPARYWRLRFADDCDERVAELDLDLDPDLDWYDYADRFDPCDPREEALDSAIAELCMLIRGVVPFNTLLLDGARAQRSVPPPVEQPGEQPIETRLVDFIERITTRPLAELWDREGALGLCELEAIAERHFLDDLRIVVGLALFQPFWVRSPSTWRPIENNDFTSLVEHLLLAYPTPPCLHMAAWQLSKLDDLRWMAYLIALGQGGSLRRLTELANRRWPSEWAVLPHRLGACLSRVDEGRSPSLGMMTAEVFRLGGSEVEVRLLTRDHSFVIDPSSTEIDPPDLDFWRATVGWLIRHRGEIDDPSATLILAWARHMHIERQRLDETFRWRGRTVASALREATAYHESWSQNRRNRLSWRHHGWDWQGFHAGFDWSIAELTNSTQLQEESRAMSHCVYSYDHACASRRSAIFSLRQNGQRRVTIELQLATKRVVQAKRACNQEPSSLELAVIEQWRTKLGVESTGD